jgi:hydroxyacylglutathione hydrolase
MRVVPVPCLKDNYAYLVICEASGQAAVVDPGEAAPVIAAARREGVRLAAVWATHHHPDHVGGVGGLPDDVAVIGHASDVERGRIPRAGRGVADGDVVELGTSVRARIVHNPGHTTGAISYWIEDGAGGAVFTGDTLFGAGCGRLFEGPPPMMHASLARLAALPPATRVYFGHEYTAANLRFAAAVEPDNRDVAARAARSTGTTTPSTIADEHATNPFLRARVPAVRAAAAAHAAALGRPPPATDADVFAILRAWKDAFRS